MCEEDILCQFRSLRIVDDDKLLVCGGVEVEAVTLSFEQVAHLLGHHVGMTGDVEIQVVSEQGVKLQTVQAPFGDDRSVLFLDAEEMVVGIVMGEHHRLAAQRSHLRTTDIEHVAVLGEVGQADVVARCCESVAQTGTVHIQRNIVFAAQLVDVVEFLGRIERSVFCGEGDIDQSRIHGMFPATVVHVVVEVFVQLQRIHLTLVVAQGDDLMLCKLDGSCLVGVDMSAIYSDDTLIGMQDGVDDCCVGLGAPRQEEYLCIGCTAGSLDLLLCLHAPFIVAIAETLFVVGLYQSLQHLRVRTVIIIAFK